MILTRVLPLFTVISVFALDRFAKHWVRSDFLYGESRAILPFFNLTHIENTGAAFGMGQNMNTFFIGLSVVILIVLFVLARRLGKENIKLKIAFALVVGGALGNLYDRIIQGGVTDFLDFHLGNHHWPAFNVADSSIFVGAVLLAVLQWKSKAAEPVKS
ncbi:MAG: signal peptidase II [Elusimicrobia bacterium RIFCSPLOWO2_01_FULL_54_10]|nr:MAG: signal peptidase II [Elusimicrobia bacterium RIFCSPLOWO2_01_FULL_54_10]